jgi:hypothetical protein
MLSHAIEAGSKKLYSLPVEISSGGELHSQADLSGSTLAAKPF